MNLARTLSITMAVLVASLAGAGVVDAHSGLGAASPAPGSTVGGEITEIQLRYASAVVDVAGSVTDPEGATISSEFVQDTALAVTIRLSAPLDVSGEYAVRHSSTSVDDGDRVDAAYLFTYDPSAPSPQLEVLDVDDAGRSTWVWVLLAVAIGGLVVLGVRLVRSVRRMRSTRA